MAESCHRLEEPLQLHISGQHLPFSRGHDHFSCVQGQKGHDSKQLSDAAT